MVCLCRCVSNRTVELKDVKTYLEGVRGRPEMSEKVL